MCHSSQPPACASRCCRREVSAAVSDAARKRREGQAGHRLVAFPPVLAPGAERPVAYARVEGLPGFGDLRNARAALVRNHQRLCHFMRSSHAASVTPLGVIEDAVGER